jgi:excisionase family DNA binding protein
MDELPRLLTVDETAAVLRISRSSTYELIHAGLVPSLRIGSRIRVPRERLLAMLETPE